MSDNVWLKANDSFHYTIVDTYTLQLFDLRTILEDQHQRFNLRGQLTVLD